MRDLLRRFFAWFRNHESQIIYDPHSVDPKTLPMNAPDDTIRELIYRQARWAVGKNLRRGAVPMDLGCVEQLVGVVGGVTAMPAMTGTAQLNAFLASNNQWKGTLDLLPGNVMVAVSGTGNHTIEHGHTWILGENGLAYSNSSKNGLWEQNYTIDSIVARFRTQGGFPLRVYQHV